MDGPKNAPLNVAIYCRVGFSEYALEIQKQRAAAVIREHDDWNFATTYTDFGTGPQFNRRPSFQMMMADCRKGLIDKILVRSISTLHERLLHLTWRHVFQRPMWTRCVIKLNVRGDSLFKCGLRGIIFPIQLFLFQGCKESLSHSIIVRFSRIGE